MREGGEHLVQESAFVWGTEAGRARTADAKKTIPTSHPKSHLAEKQQTTKASKRAVGEKLNSS